MDLMKYKGVVMEDTGSRMSDEAKAFFRSFKNYLKKNLPGCELEGFKPNHYDAGGFITRPDGKVIYVHYSLERFDDYSCRANFDATDARRGVLYRVAENTKDLSGRGGRNNFTSLNNMVSDIMSLVA